MELNVGKEIAVLKRMTVGELRERYAEVFGEETHARNKQWLVKRVIWRLQSMSEGNLSERARTRAAELANDADLRRRALHVSGLLVERQGGTSVKPPQPEGLWLAVSASISMRH